jgi:DivIVA domain-containing protein
VDRQDLERLRTPGFKLARRGYDRREVDRFLTQLVDWLETDAPREIGHLAVTRKLELVGKSTTHILLAAEQEAEEMLRHVEADIAELHAEAQETAREIRRAADEYAEHVREGAER